MWPPDNPGTCLNGTPWGGEFKAGVYVGRGASGHGESAARAEIPV